ncbi:MAG TPA: adenosylcobinamide-GDP ribazoletransferase [Candidatus Elarobacter sp.]|jgi:adenosylcobinamide-GDP ribazoletransferase|nr:adenosylcobinamide-GDP ribazoletransferase [Candidatus Elarobacter sp.]
MNGIRALRAAFSYFTILPFGTAEPPDAVALAWLPLVGAVVGAIAGTAAYLVAYVAPPAVAVAVAFGLSIVLSGAIHLDGFLDGCDAFFASVSPERRLEILKDPRHGTFALAGFAVIAVFWLAALWSLDPLTYPLALALTGAASRWSAVIHALWFAYGRAGTPPRALERKPPFAVLAIGAVLVALLAFALRAPGCAAAFVALIVAAGAITWARVRLGGGVVGDAYGFTIVIAEVAALVTLAAL